MFYHRFLIRWGIYSGLFQGCRALNLDWNDIQVTIDGPKIAKDMSGFTRFGPQCKIDFWTDEILEAHSAPGVRCNLMTLAYRLSLHEIRHVWQYKHNPSLFQQEAIVPYDFRRSEQDANGFALGQPLFKSVEELKAA